MVPVYHRKQLLPKQLRALWSGRVRLHSLGKRVNLGHEGYYLLYKGVISSLFATKTTMARVSKRARKCRYPCERCQEECVRDVIECSKCECWTHASCIPMDKTMLRNWIGADKDFLCKSCAYTGGSYDIVKALQRYVVYFIYCVFYFAYQ